MTEGLVGSSLPPVPGRGEQKTSTDHRRSPYPPRSAASNPGTVNPKFETKRWPGCSAPSSVTLSACHLAWCNLPALFPFILRTKPLVIPNTSPSRERQLKQSRVSYIPYSRYRVYVLEPHNTVASCTPYNEATLINGTYHTAQLLSS